MLIRSRHKIVYPGHPVTLAVLIMQRYESLDSATALGHEFPRVLEDEEIPGSGVSLHMTLDLLKRVARGEDPAEAAALAERLWTVGRAGGNVKAVAPGQEEAESYKPAFLETVASWVRGVPPLPRPERRQAVQRRDS